MSLTRKRLLGLAAAGVTTAAVPASVLARSNSGSKKVVATHVYKSGTHPAASVRATEGWYVRDEIAPGMTAPRSILLLANESIPFQPWVLDWDIAIIETLSDAGCAIGVVGQDRRQPPSAWLTANASATLAATGVDVNHEPVTGRTLASGVGLDELAVTDPGVANGVEKRVGWFHTPTWDVGVYTWIGANSDRDAIQGALETVAVA